MPGAKIPWVTAFLLAKRFPRSDFGPVEAAALRLLAAAFLAVTFLGIFIGGLQALSAATVVAGERIVKFCGTLETKREEMLRYTNKLPR
jgi:hypothetical protein